MAPFTPFLAEIIYQELKKKAGLKEESVHLREWPKVALRQAQGGSPLLAGMAEVRRLAASALAERAKAGIRVRQPLQILRIKKHEAGGKELLTLLADEVNVKEVVVDPTIKGEVELDTTITPELREEGLVRELVRNIQEMRRDAGLRPVHRVRVEVGGNADVERLALKWQTYIKKEAGAAAVEVGGKKEAKASRDLNIDGMRAWMGIRKA